MRILITGASGMLGSALALRLHSEGEDVRSLTRGRGSGVAGVREFRWDPDRGEIDPEALAGLDAAVHLAGENIGARRWNARVRARLRESRLRGTGLLAESLARATPPPATLLTASAVGIYGDRGDEPLTEDAPPGQGFLADLCREWEAAAEPAARAGIRVVRLRTATVLTRAGGALPRMLLPFRLGLGARFGHGRQYFSWIAAEDVVPAIQWLLAHPGVDGPVNLAAPQAVTNAEFTRTLARVLRRPAVFAVPGFALRLLVGGLADEGLLASQRAVPRRLLDSGFAFAEPALEPALRRILADDGGRPTAASGRR